MISFWTNADASRGIAAYRANRGRAIAARVRPRIYEEIDHSISVTDGPQIFAALDQLSERQLGAVAALWEGHARSFPTRPRLNHPSRFLRRFDLLSRLYMEGLNRYRVYQPAATERIERFPVFVRDVARHNGPLTPLLGSVREVRAALRRLRFRGYRVTDLMIAEFCDTSDANHIFRKYAAFKVGDTILPWHLMVSKEWNVKSEWNRLDADTVREGLEFMEDNPHADWLRQVFAIAHVDYGRIDYGVLDGSPQVWEINLNPSLGGRLGKTPSRPLAKGLESLRESGRQLRHACLREAFVALDEGGREANTCIRLEPTIVAPFRAAVRHHARKQRMLGWLHRLHEHRWLGAPIRVLVRRFPPRPRWMPQVSPSSR